MLGVQQVVITEGTSGSGKTYVRGAIFVGDHLFESGVERFHSSNLPLKPDAIGAHVAKRRGGSEEEQRRIAEDIARRIERIPREVLKKWACEESGPWEYYKDSDIKGVHIALDESHNYISRAHSAAHRRKWAEFCGELRHRGAVIEFITQSANRLASEVVEIADEVYQLTKAETRRLFMVPMSDWLQLFAKVTGRYRSFFAVQTYSKNGGKLTADGPPILHRRSPEYFELYDSFSATEAGQAGGEPDKMPFQALSGPKLLRWFVRRNRLATGLMSAVCCLVVWLFMFGGFGWCLRTLPDVALSFVGLDTLGGPKPKPKPTAKTKTLVTAKVPKEPLPVRPIRVQPMAADAAKDEPIETRVALIEPGGFWTDNGDRWRIGETVDVIGGGFNVREVEWDRRRVLGSGGQRLVLGTVLRLRDDGGTAPGSSWAGFRPRSPYGGDRGDITRPSGSRGRILLGTPQRVSAGPTGRPVPSVANGQNGRVGGVIVRAGRSPSDVGRGQRNGVGSPERPSSSVGHSTDSRGESPIPGPIASGRSRATGASGPEIVR